MRSIDLENERLFENQKALGFETRAAQSKFYWATDLDANRHIGEVFRCISDKNVLEIGCASGVQATIYCKYAKNYTGIDISDEAINNCKKIQGLENAQFLCTDGHSIPMADSSLDCVIVDSLLHHMDLQTAFKEITRVLKDDGRLLFKEPLGTNPLFQFYRYITPKARTVDERPFTFGDLKLMQSYFVLDHVIWFGFSNILSAFCRLTLVRMVLSRFDATLSKTPLKYFYWQFAGTARKKDNISLVQNLNGTD